YESPLELLKALCDAIKAHRSLYLDASILHRDISEHNIIITDPDKAGGYSGMLINLDLAKEVGIGRSGARRQAGTMEFMAIEVLLNIDHTYRHDLESFFYVLIWQCARNGWGKDKYSKDSKLRLIVGTPQDPNRLYDPIIKAYDDAITQFELGNLTHDKFIYYLETILSTESDKLATMLDFEPLKARYYAPSEPTSSAGRPDEYHQPQRDFQSKITSKRKVPPSRPLR
ncbi:hypothetical protein ACJ73_09269, partial [Blastomyces percursus]